MATVIVEVVERVIVIRHRAELQAKCHDANLYSSPGIGKDQEVRCDFAAEERIEPIIGHDVLAEFDVGVVLEKLPASRVVVELGARNEGYGDAFTRAQTPPVFRRWFEPSQIHTHVAAEIKPVQVA